MHSITKRFGSYPFAHRQHKHDGHCAMVHGHNWFFEIELESSVLDENGFVYDFGKFKDLKEWFNHMFDHTLLINEHDPAREFFEKHQQYWQLRIVPCGSAELLAEMVFNHVREYLKGHPARIIRCAVFEDEKDQAEYRA